MTYDEQEAGGQPPPGEPASGSEPASEASGDDKDKARAVPAVLDDPRSIEDGPKTTSRVALGSITLGQIEEFERQGRTIEIDPDGQAYDVVELPRDHAEGRAQRGVAGKTRSVGFSVIVSPAPMAVIVEEPTSTSWAALTTLLAVR